MDFVNEIKTLKNLNGLVKKAGKPQVGKAIVGGR
jgi:hypothetical protein